MNKKLIYRFIKLYYSDKMAVFYSLLGAIVVIVLYFLFLAKNQVTMILEQTNGLAGQKEVSYLVHSMILSGLLSVTSMTSVLGAYGTMVSDWETHIMMDFRSSPLKPWEYPLASVLSSWIVGVLISGISLLFYGFGIFFATGYFFSLNQIGTTVLLILFSSMFSALFMGAVCSIIRTSRTYSGVSLLVGTFIGFANGLYVPITTLTETVRNVITVLPFIHTASLFREALCQEAVDMVFKDVPDTIRNNYMGQIGLSLQLGDFHISQLFSISYLSVISLVSFFIMLFIWTRKAKQI